jgi:hypothetical protein
MFEKLKNFFKRKKKNNRVILDNPAKKSFVKKRKHLIVNLDFLK